MDKVNIREKFAQLHEHWSPRIAAETNDCAVRTAARRLALGPPAKQH
jgi:hypothetical protein